MDTLRLCRRGVHKGKDSSIVRADSQFVSETASWRSRRDHAPLFSPPAPQARFMFRGPRPWQSFRAPFRRPTSTGAGELRSAGPAPTATVAWYGRTAQVRPRHPVHGISDSYDGQRRESICNISSIQLQLARAVCVACAMARSYSRSACAGQPPFASSLRTSCNMRT